MAIIGRVERGRGSDAVVRLNGVTRMFGSVPALVRVTMQIDRGEVVLLRGANGAGKSTLIRVVSTALSPTFGEGSVLGHDLIRGRHEIRRSVELLGHRTRLYEELTAQENLDFAAGLFGVRRGRPREHLERVGLGDVAGERVRSFSHGMRQRVALARVLMRDPELILLDEPYAGLDQSSRGLVDELVTAAAARGRTVVMSSHDPAPRPLADRTITMAGGRVIAASGADASIGSG
jgi:ABC-type multidrug transport system ATPase subunit